MTENKLKNFMGIAGDQSRESHPTVPAGEAAMDEHKREQLAALQRDVREQPFKRPVTPQAAPTVTPAAPDTYTVGFERDPNTGENRMRVDIQAAPEPTYTQEKQSPEYEAAHEVLVKTLSCPYEHSQTLILMNWMAEALHRQHPAVASPTPPAEVSEIAPRCLFCGELANHKCGDDHDCGDCCGMRGSLAHDKYAYKWLHDFVRPNLKRLTEALNAQAATMPCGHPTSLLIKSVESDYTFCELCEARSELRDALQMEAHYKAALAAVESSAKAAAQNYINREAEKDARIIAAESSATALAAEVEELREYEAEEVAFMAKHGVLYNETFLDGWAKVLDERDATAATLERVRETLREWKGRIGGASAQTGMLHIYASVETKEIDALLRSLPPVVDTPGQS